MQQQEQQQHPNAKGQTKCEMWDDVLQSVRQLRPSNFKPLLSDKRGQLIWEYMKKNPIPLFPNYGRDSAP